MQSGHSCGVHVPVPQRPQGLRLLDARAVASCARLDGRDGLAGTLVLRRAVLTPRLDREQRAEVETYPTATPRGRGEGSLPEQGPYCGPSLTGSNSII